MLYTTRDEAVQREIVDVLGEDAKDHDIEAIANDVIEFGHDARTSGYFNNADPEEFWDTVENNQI